MGVNVESIPEIKGDHRDKYYWRILKKRISVEEAIRILPSYWVRKK